MLDRIKSTLLTLEEQNAFDYFHGTGFYKDPQNPKTFPNVFDSRDSFVVKMQNREMRNKFLDSYNKRKFTENNSTVD